MGTAFSDVINQYALVEIDDVRLAEQLERNPALFFRVMSGYLLDAIPRFNRPPEIRQWLTYTAPLFGDYNYTSETAQTAPVEIATGLLGFDLCSAGLTGTDKYGNPYYTPIEATYNAVNGNITIEQDLAEGQEVQFDFYTDGEFTRDLTATIQRILGLAAQYVWESRFANAYLIQVPKIKDKSFSTEAEGGTSRSATERLRMLRHNLDCEILAYEQMCAYISTVPQTDRIIKDFV